MLPLKNCVTWHRQLFFPTLFKEYSNCRIYDREVVELSKDVSLLILIPSPEHVCSCPGDGDIFSDNEKFISIPVPVFEMSK